MTLDQQSFVALVLVAWAVSYVVWRVWRALFRKGNSGCGACAKCPAESSAPTTLVTIDSLLQASNRQK